MKPITFSCQAFIPLSSEEICSQIADMDKWEEFSGYGVLPGIKKARYETQTPNMVGSRIAVENLDGSTHVEEIFLWNPAKEVGMRLQEFSPPLNRLADHFVETWTFTAKDTGTDVIRSFELHPKSGFTRPFLWMISLLFRKAIDRHLDLIASSA